MRRRLEYLDWARIEQDTDTLAAMLRPLAAPFHGIIAIARGGLVPAALLARALDCRVVETLCIGSYQNDRRGTPRLLKPAAAGDGTGWLLVDDLADTGATARAARALLPGARFATLYVKPAGRMDDAHRVAEFPQDTWLVFPWERIPDDPEPAP